MTIHLTARHRASAARLALLGLVLLFSLACAPIEEAITVQAPAPTQTAVALPTASATLVRSPVEAQAATATATRQPSPSETSSPSPTPTSTLAPSSTATPSPTATHSPLPSPTLRRLRFLIPQSLIDRADQLAPILHDHPAYTFSVEVAPSSQGVVDAVRGGHADLGIAEGMIPAEVTAHAFKTEAVATIVSFYKRLEEISMADIASLLAGDDDVRDRLGITGVGAWDASILEIVAYPESDLLIASPGELVLGVAADRSLLAMVPVGALDPRVRALDVDGHRVHDAAYPLKAHEAIVVADAALSPLAREMASSLAGHVATAPAPVELALVGDLMLARDMGDALRQHGPAYALGDVRHLLEGADLTLGNLECAIGDLGEPEPKAYTFQAPITATESLRQAGFDLLNVANNHILDFGVEAMAQTFDLLRQAGIGWMGAGMSEAEANAPVYRDVRGLRIAFLGYAHYLTETSTGFPAEAFVAVGDKPGIAWADVDRIAAQVAQARQQADVVVVALHAGREYWERPTEFQREAARAAIDAGASLVWGHHAHSWQGIEFYRDGVIMYSLGDFVFDQMTTNDTAVARLWIDDQGVRQVHLDPAMIVENGRPVPATGPEGRAILDWLYGLCELLLG